MKPPTICGKFAFLNGSANFPQIVDFFFFFYPLVWHPPLSLY